MRLKIIPICMHVTIIVFLQRLFHQLKMALAKGIKITFINLKWAYILLISCCFFKSHAQNPLPYVVNNLCLDTFIRVNNTPSISIQYAKNMVVADFNNDLYNEIVIADATAKKISVYSFNINSLSFDLQSSIDVSSKWFSGIGSGVLQAIDVGDFNMDNKLDIIFTAKDSIYVYKQSATTAFNFSFYTEIEVPLYQNGVDHYLKVEDINNDGWDDFYLLAKSTFTASKGVSITPYLNTLGSISMQPTQTIFKSFNGNLTTNSLDISSKDIDLNGLKDLMITFTGIPDSVCFLQNTSVSNALVISPVTFSLNTSASNFTINSSEIADVNGDNIPDFIFSGSTATGSNNIAIVIGNNTFALPTPNLIQFSSLSINDFKIEDINDDKLLDFIGIGSTYTNQSTSVLVYFGTSNLPSYSNNNSYLISLGVNINANEMQVIDIDNNGMKDIVFKPWKTNASLIQMIPNFSYELSASASPSTICLPYPSKLLLTTTNKNISNINYSWQRLPIAASIATSALYQTTVTGQYAGFVNFEMYSGKFCKLASDTLQINLFVAPVIMVSTQNQTYCNGDIAIITASGAATYSWSSSTNTLLLTGQTISQQINGLTSYTVTGELTNGCKASKDITINIDPSCVIKVYSGITPNNDGNNDAFTIDNIEKYPNNKVTIFNRWGQKIFETTNYNNSTNFWPTADQLKSLSPSTYFYSINFGNSTETKGWVELLTN